jgi:hypothetical protein
LKKGYLSNATSFSFLADLRPDFGPGLEIMGLIPVVQLRINTDSENQAESEFVVQLDETMLRELREMVQKAEKTLDVLDRQDTLLRFLIKETKK